MGNDDAYFTILRELDALRRGQDGLLQEVQNVARSQEQQTRWLAERIAWLEDLKPQPGVTSPASFAFQHPSTGGQLQNRTPGLNPSRSPPWAISPQGTAGGSIPGGRNARSAHFNTRRSIRRQSSAGTSNRTFEDALEQFGSSNVSSRCSDSDSAASRHAAALDADLSQTRSPSFMNQDDNRGGSPPPTLDSPNMESWERQRGVSDESHLLPDTAPGPLGVGSGGAKVHVLTPTQQQAIASPFMAASQQSKSFDTAPAPPPPHPATEPPRTASVHFHSSTNFPSMSTANPSMANLPDALAPVATTASAAAVPLPVPPVAVGQSQPSPSGLQPVLLLPPGFHPPTGATLMPHGLAQWGGSSRLLIGGPPPVVDQGHVEHSGMGRSPPQVQHGMRHLATRSMYEARTHDTILHDEAAHADAGHLASRDHHQSIQGTLPARPSGAGTPPVVRSRYMDNIPLLLRHAYEAQDLTINTQSAHPAAGMPLGRVSARTTHQKRNSSDIHALHVVVHHPVNLPGSGPGTMNAADAQVAWQNLPSSPSRGTPAAPLANGLPIARGGSGADQAGLATIYTGPGGGNLASGDTHSGGGGGSSTPPPGRLGELMSDASPLLLKSFTHMKRPSMSDLVRHSGLPRSAPGYGLSENGEVGGDAHVNLGYSGNSLYVKAVAPENQAVMLGDEDDPDKPLTVSDRLRLLAYGLINPEGRTKWDLFILLLLVWVCFASPLIVCFDLNASLSDHDTLAWLEMTVDMIFVIDITLNFRTAYYDSMGNLVTDRARIARHYARTWFAFDLVSVVPFDLLTTGTLGFLSMLKLLRVVRVGQVMRTLRMYRLMRVTRLPRILDRIEQWLDKGVLQIMMFAMAVGLLAHLSACLFFYMALLTYFMTDSWEGTWVQKQDLVDASLAHQYVNSIYWAFTTVATVGYGDITPTNQKEKVMAILVMASGVTLVGYVTSSITKLMGIRHAVSTKTAVKKQAVNDVLKNRQVPSALARRVRAFFNYESTKVIREDEEALLQDLPFKLRSRFLQHAYVDTLSRLPCFVRLRPDILIDVIAQLKCVYYTDGDIISLQGDLVSDMFFIHEGKMELRVYDFPDHADPWAVLEAVNKDELAGYQYTIQGRLKRTYHFGHASAVHGGTWPGTVVARNCCELFSLSHEAIQGLANRHAHALGALLDIAEPPASSRDEDPSSFTINLLRVDIDPEAIAADFPLLDPPPRKSGLGHLLGAAVKGGLGVLTTLSIHRTTGDPNQEGGPGNDPNNKGGAGGGQGMMSAAQSKANLAAAGLSRFASSQRQLETCSSMSQQQQQQPGNESAPLLTADTSTSAPVSGGGAPTAAAMARTGLLASMLRRSADPQGTHHPGDAGVDGMEAGVSDTQPLLQR